MWIKKLIIITKINIKMLKSILINKKDFNNIENAFHFYLDNCNLTQKEQNEILKTMQSIITQCLD